MRDRTLWTWHIFAGVVILVLLGLHMTIMHLNGTFPTFNNPFGGEAEAQWGQAFETTDEHALELLEQPNNWKRAPRSAAAKEEKE